MAAVLGLNAKLYIQTDGVAGSDGWTELTNVQDLTLNLSTERADVTTRGNNGFKAEIATLKNASITFESVFDPSDATFGSLSAAWLAGTLVGVRALTGPADEQTTQGVVSDMSVLDFTQSQPLADKITVAIELAPALSATATTYVTTGPDYTP